MWERVKKERAQKQQRMHEVECEQTVRERKGEKKRDRGRVQRMA